MLTRNPMNYHQVREIILTPDTVKGIVFWTKNPLPMLDRLDELNDFMYYIQFSLTPYGKDIEPNLPQKDDTLIPAFKKLADKIGRERVIWRYDPILLNKKYTMDYHIHAFGKIANELCNFTQRVTISFIDTDYRGVKYNIKELELTDFPTETKFELAFKLAAIARNYNLRIDACAQPLDLTRFGIDQGRCIDDRLFSELLGYKLDVKKDKNQRPACGCASSADIGVYNTCKNGCRYCYANYNPKAINSKNRNHNPQSAFMI